MSVWEDVVGQPAAVAELSEAAIAADRVVTGGDGTGMTHAWVLSGPPGSGRSVAARAFAAALQCATSAGCGTCASCISTLRGTHPDLTVVNTPGLSIQVGEVRGVVRSATLSPSLGRWQVIVVEDADRLTDRAADALLKDLEEPATRTVWLLCAPTVEEVLPTIRSRCRQVNLRIPPAAAVAEVLVRRDGIDPAMAAFAARASQGHIGRARRLAQDESARLRRAEVLRVPASVDDVGSALIAAANLVEAATEDAKSRAEELDAAETEVLLRALGIGPGARRPRGTEGQFKELEAAHKARYTRTVRDSLDRALIDLAAYYRDVLALQVGADVPLTHDELRPTLRAHARRATPEATLRRIEAVLAARTAVAANVAPLLAAEQMTLALHSG